MTSSGSTCLASPAIVVVSLIGEIDSKSVLGVGDGGEEMEVLRKVLEGQREDS